MIRRTSASADTLLKHYMRDSDNTFLRPVDPALSFGTYSGASGAPSITGTVSANFTAQTASFNATVSGGCGCTNPTFTASAANMPIVGAGFSASTDASRPPNVGAMSVACSGSGCGSSGTAQGRFDGLFRNSAGTADPPRSPPAARARRADSGPRTPRRRA